MRVSQKCEYALRAMLELALRADHDQPARTADIARTQHIPEKFLELILVELRRAGLISSQRGPVGGHRMARAADKISVGDVWRAIDGQLTEFPSGTVKGKDPFRFVWEQVDRSVAEVVDSITLADVRRRAETQATIPDYTI